MTLVFYLLFVMLALGPVLQTDRYQDQGVMALCWDKERAHAMTMKVTSVAHLSDSRVLCNFPIKPS